MKSSESVYIAGHRGLVGSAVVRKFEKEGFSNLILRTHQELDLINQAQVQEFFHTEKIDYAIIAAARVGGIHANSEFIADFLYENLMIASNTIHAAAQTNVKKLLFLGSSCIYPKLAPQPIQEDHLLTGPLESSNEGYAIAKISGLKLCEMYQRQYQKRFISAMPTNLYGPGDNFHPTHSHVAPGLMRRFHEAKVKNLPEVVVWGTGKPMRELLHVEDLADAIFLLMNAYESPQTINVGTGIEHSILEIAEIIREVVGYRGKLRFDSSKPDGTPRKILDVSRIQALGWKHQYDLKKGLSETYQWALQNNAFSDVA